MTNEADVEHRARQREKEIRAASMTNDKQERLPDRRRYDRRLRMDEHMQTENDDWWRQKREKQVIQKEHDERERQRREVQARDDRPRRREAIEHTKAKLRRKAKGSDE